MTPLIIGSLSDTHLRIVSTRLNKRGVEPVIMDADQIGRVGYAFSSDSLRIGDRLVAKGGTGWLRRIAINRWTNGETVGSVADMTFRSRVQLIAALTRCHERRWLTDLGSLQDAEDRFHQLAVAAEMGIASRYWGHLDCGRDSGGRHWLSRCSLGAEHDARFLRRGRAHRRVPGRADSGGHPAR